MVRRKPRLVQRYSGSTKRYRLFTSSKPEIVQRFSRSKGEELTDAGMSDSNTKEFFSVKKRGNRYVGMTNRMPVAPPRAIEKLVRAHEYEHLREMAFLDRHGFKRNSKSFLAQMSEPFIRDEIFGWKSGVPNSFEEIREIAHRTTRNSIGIGDQLNYLVLGILKFFPTRAQKNTLVTSLFRSREMRPHLECLNSVSVGLDTPSADLPKARESLLAVIDFCEKRVKARRRRFKSS